MAWTTPKTWANGEALTFDEMNTYMRDNQNALFDRPEAEVTLNEAADYVVSVTSFADIDATNLSLTITPNNHVLCGFRGSVKMSAINLYCYLDITIGGVLLGGDDGLLHIRPASATEVTPVLLLALITPDKFTPGSATTFRLQAKVSGGTATLYAGAGTASNDVHGQFWVHEF